MQQVYSTVLRTAVCRSQENRNNGHRRRTHVNTEYCLSVVAQHPSDILMCSDSCTCCHTDTEVTDQAVYLARSQSTDPEPPSPTSCPERQTPVRVATKVLYFWGRYHGGRRPSSDDSFHSPAVIPPSALDKPSITKRYHPRRTRSHTSPRRSPTMVTLDDARFVECRW